MKTTRIILIADDEKLARESWERDIAEFNEDMKANILFEAVWAENCSQAIWHFERTRINCASVDLRMPLDDKTPAPAANPATGNDVLERLLVQVGVPAVVYSGYPQEASEGVRASPIKVMMKTGGGAMTALRWLADHEPLMSAMEASGRKIATESARLFTRSIWPRWSKSWQAGHAADEHLTNVITRQLASHVAETLGVPETDYHPEEFYQVPSLHDDRLATGDLVGCQDNVWVVVTPRCNMARDKYPAHIMLAMCRPVGTWNDLVTKFKSGDSKKLESAEKDLRNFATQNHAIATHFLPPFGGHGPWLVDFKEIMTVPSAEVPALLKGRIASISTSFVPNLVQRYAAYLGRIGQPDLDCKVMRVHLSR